VIPEPAPVTLEVLNALGQWVATLVNERQPPGRHTVQLDASTLASGLYVYRLRAGANGTLHHRMLVVR